MVIELTIKDAEFAAEIIRNRPISLPDEEAERCLYVSNRIIAAVEAVKSLGCGPLTTRRLVIQEAIDAVRAAGGDNEDYHIEAIENHTGITKAQPSQP